MPLPLKLQRYSLGICFAICLLPFVAINLLMYVASFNCCDGDTVVEVGFPLKWWISGWAIPHVIWNALIGDLLLAIVASLVGGKALKTVLEPNS